MYEITVKQCTMKVVSKQMYTEIARDTDDKAKYGYVTKDVEEEVVLELYAQRVETLDLVAVISAVNAPAKELT